ncbi:hypothetical protein ABPG74_021833 [Tetrahymena malaccensis]
MEEEIVYNSNLQNQVEQIKQQQISEEESALLIDLVKQIHFISSENPLAREKGQIQFEQTFNVVFENPILQDCLKQIFAAAQRQLDQNLWQEQMSGLYVIRIEVQRYDCTHERYQEIYNLSTKYLDNQENRIREIASDVLASIGAKDKDCFSLLRSHICNYLNQTFEAVILPQISHGINEVQEEESKDSHSNQHHSHQVQVYKDTEICQWQTKNCYFLESYIQCLKKAFLLMQQKNEGNDLIDKEIMEVTLKASLHVHKHIREASVGLAQVFSQIMKEEDFKLNAQDLCIIIGRGLGDSFTQVRHQAVKAVKDFFKKCEEFKIKDSFTPQLIYKFCFNIHHPAEGLKAFTRLSWMEIFPVGGRDLVAQNALATTQYYILQSYSRNHEIRQAACICLQEMISKVMDTNEQSKQVVRSLHKDILEALLNCSHFEPNSCVREESLKCISKLLDQMGDLLSDEERNKIAEVSQFHLADQSNQVKQNAAMVLGSLFKQKQNEEEKKAYIEEIKDRIKNVNKIDVQPSAPVNSGQETYAHPSQQQISIAKNRFVSEYFEGLVALVKELAYAIGKDKSQITQNFCDLINYNMRNLNFEKNENIKENIWVMYSEILTKTLNKKNTKDLIEDLLDPVFKDFKHEKVNVRNAAQNLIRDLAKFIGPNILKGRIEMKGDLGYMSEYDKLNLV